MWHKVVSEKLKNFHTVNKFPDFMKAEISSSCFTKANTEISSEIPQYISQLRPVFIVFKYC